MVPTSKETVRREIFAKLRALPGETREKASAEICRTIRSSPAWKPGSVVHLFAALPSEPNLVPLIEMARTDGVRVVFPRVVDATAGSLAFHEVTDASQLTPHSSPIPEPDPNTCPEVSVGEITTAFLPGVAFDPSTGVRLGRGGGFYDRLLASPDFTASTTGICFALQQRPLESEPHDRPVRALITEEGRFALSPTGIHISP